MEDEFESLMDEEEEDLEGDIDDMELDRLDDELV